MALFKVWGPGGGPFEFFCQFLHLLGRQAALGLLGQANSPDVGQHTYLGHVYTRQKLVQLLVIMVSMDVDAKANGGTVETSGETGAVSSPAHEPIGTVIQIDDSADAGFTPTEDLPRHVHEVEEGEACNRKGRERGQEKGSCREGDCS